MSFELFGQILNALGLALSPLLLLPLIHLFAPGALSERAVGPMRALAAFASAVNKGVASGVIWFALAMAVVQFVIVILRHVFGVSFLWLQESMTYMHGALFLLAVGYALLKDEHVRVDVFYRDASERWKAKVNFFGVYVFLIPVAVLAIWMAGPYVAASWAVREGSNEASGIQAVFLLKSLIPAFGLLLILQGFALAATSAETLRTGDRAAPAGA